MSTDLSLIGNPNLAGQLGVKESGDEFSVTMTPTKKLVFKQKTNGGEIKKTAVVNKKRTVLYLSVPNQKG